MITKYQTINPATGQVLAEYPTLVQEALDHIIAELKHGQYVWRNKDLDYRVACIRKIRDLLLQRLDEYAHLITSEMGKPLRESIAEVRKCAFLCEYYSDNAHTFLSPQKINYDGLNAERVFEPLGLIYTIMPWNFPFWQVFRATIPNLLLGNGIVLKHAENVIGAGYAIESILQQATGLSILKNIVIDLSLSEYLIAHHDIAAVTLTGSKRAGSTVAKKAGEACKKVVLELGGSDAYIIRKDVDVEKVAKQIVTVRMANAGQVCISPKRLIVDKAIKQAFEEAVVNAVAKIKVGNPQAHDTDVGPMARVDLRNALKQQIAMSVKQGAKLLIGGCEIPSKTPNVAYYQPTVLTDVTKGMVAFTEELFGPVISIIVSNDDEDAIELANASQYGLGSGIFTQDIELAKQIAKHRIEAGMCFINQCVTSHPALPFGGIKQSGFGRECSVEALRELANIKTIVVA